MADNNITPTEAELHLLACEREFRAARLHEIVAVARRQGARAALDKAREAVSDEANDLREGVPQ